MTKAEIVERIAQGEDSRTQFKRGPVGVAKLAAELAAFSNASGGIIVFGIGDDGKVVGVNAADKRSLNDEISNAANDNVRPAVYPQTEYHTIRGKQILCVTVAEGVSKPYSDKSGSYDDRIEIVSPGSLANHLTVEKIKAGVSVARNPVLFTFATKEIPYRGLGSGIKRILEIVQDIEFKSDDELNLFTVTVKRNKENATANEAIKNFYEVAKDEDEVVKGGDEAVNGVDEAVIEVVKENPGIRKPRLVPLVGKSRATVERMIAHLIKVGKIEFRGAPKNGGYYLKEQK